MPRSLSTRIVAGALIWSVLAFTLGGLALVQVFQGAVERSLDDRLSVVMNNVIADLTAREDGTVGLRGRMGDARFARVFSGWYWQIEPLDADAQGASLRSRSLWDEVIVPPAPPPALGIGRLYADGPDGQRLRLHQRRVDLAGLDGPIRLIVAGEADSMRGEVTAFTTALGWSVAVVAFVLALALVLQVRLALAPLEAVRAGLAAVRAGRAERLSGEFPSEIAPLADELNRVLDRNRDVVDRARTQVGNLAHALKTPLAVLSASTGRPDAPLKSVVEREAATMRRQVDHYLSRARMAAAADVIGTRTAVRPVAEDLIRTLKRLNRDRAVSVTLDCDPSLAVRVERADLEDMIGNLMDNAFKWTRGRIDVSVRAEGPMAIVSICDDGPGLTEAQIHEALKRGVRLDETVPGSGLGLAIVDDIAGAHRGALTLARAPLGGLEARLALPRS